MGMKTERLAPIPNCVHPFRSLRIRFQFHTPYPNSTHHTRTTHDMPELQVSVMGYRGQELSMYTMNEPQPTSTPHIRTVQHKSEPHTPFPTPALNTRRLHTTTELYIPYPNTTYALSSARKSTCTCPPHNRGTHASMQAYPHTMHLSSFRDMRLAQRDCLGEVSLTWIDTARLPWRGNLDLD